MAKVRNGGKKMNGTVKLKVVVEKLQKTLLLGKKWDSDKVPEDVKEGHFAVIAEDDEQLKRFVVPLSYLTHPSFLLLLEQAEDEYGFDHIHEGALTIPCRPSQLETILAERWAEGKASRVDVNWDLCKTVVRSC